MVFYDNWSRCGEIGVVRPISAIKMYMKSIIAARIIDSNLFFFRIFDLVNCSCYNGRFI